MKYYEGPMYIKGEIKSYNYETRQDVFNLQGSPNDDYIWPLIRYGSKTKENIQSLTKLSSEAKSYDLKGIINGVRYLVKERLHNNSNRVIGKMYVSYDGGASWYKVLTPK